MKKTTKKTRKNIERPIEKVNIKNLGVLIITRSKLSEIWDIVKDKVGSNEFQIHYHSVTFKCSKDGSDMYLVIPTAFYTFPQNISSILIEYKMSDIEPASKKVLDIHNKVMQKMHIVEEYLNLLKIFDSVTPMSVFDNSLHRHPHEFGFSNIDLDNDPENPGIIFRKKKAQNYPQMDSVMYFGRNNSSIVTSELRLVTVKPTKDGGIEGEYVECPTVTIIDPKKQYGMESVFGIRDEKYPHSNLCQVKYDMSIISPIMASILPNIEWGVTTGIKPQFIETIKERAIPANNFSSILWDEDELWTGDSLVPDTNLELEAKERIALMSEEEIAMMKSMGFDAKIPTDVIEFYDYELQILTRGAKE
jgi:hypothetical protein